MSVLYDASMTILSILAVIMVFLPLFGAQKRSLQFSKELAEYAEIRCEGDSSESNKTYMYSMVKMSRSWLVALIILIASPFLAFKSGASICKSKKNTNQSDKKLNELVGKVMIYSNPVTMSIVMLISLVAFSVGFLVIFSFVSAISLFTNDDDKLSQLSLHNSSYQELMMGIGSIYNLYSNKKFF